MMRPFGAVGLSHVRVREEEVEEERVTDPTPLGADAREEERVASVSIRGHDTKAIHSPTLPLHTDYYIRTLCAYSSHYSLKYCYNYTCSIRLMHIPHC